MPMIIVQRNKTGKIIEMRGKIEAGNKGRV